MAKQRGLGRGLGALLGGDDVIADIVADPASEGGLSSIPVDRIQRGKHQPRIHFEPQSLKELSDSIASQGVVQPIVVRAMGEGYEIVAGERRWRAAQMAGLHEIPAVVRELDERSAAAISLIENIQREDLNPLEEANALSRLQQHFDLTHQQIATLIGRSRASVSNLLRLLDLHDDVKLMLEEHKLEMGHARALLPLNGADQVDVAKEVASKALTVRAVEARVNQWLSQGKKQDHAGEEQGKDPDIKSLEQRLGEKLGAQVLITHARSGKGRLEIKYSSLDELEGILNHMI